MGKNHLFQLKRGTIQDSTSPQTRRHSSLGCSILWGKGETIYVIILCMYDIALSVKRMLLIEGSWIGGLWLREESQEEVPRRSRNIGILDTQQPNEWMIITATEDMYGNGNGTLPTYYVCTDSEDLHHIWKGMWVYTTTECRVWMYGVKLAFVVSSIVVHQARCCTICVFNSVSNWVV